MVNKIIFALVICFICSGCSTLFMMTQPKPEVILKGSAKINDGEVKAKLSRITFKQGKELNYEEKTNYSVDIYNNTNSDLNFESYIISLGNKNVLPNESNTITAAIPYFEENSVIPEMKGIMTPMDFDHDQINRRGLIEMTIHFKEGKVILK